MLLRRKYLLIFVMSLSLIVTGCSSPRPVLNEENQKEDLKTPQEQNVDVLETYRNEKFKFSFDIPTEWKGKYKAIELSNRVAFVHRGLSELDEQVPEMDHLLTIEVLSEDQFKEMYPESSNNMQNAILGRRDNLVYLANYPQCIPSSENTKYIEEWTEMNDALCEIPKRFHLENS